MNKRSIGSSSSNVISNFPALQSIRKLVRIPTTFSTNSTTTMSEENQTEPKDSATTEPDENGPTIEDNSESISDDNNDNVPDEVTQTIHNNLEPDLNVEVIDNQQEEDENGENTMTEPTQNESRSEPEENGTKEDSPVNQTEEIETPVETTEETDKVLASTQDDSTTGQSSSRKFFPKLPKLDTAGFHPKFRNNKLEPINLGIDLSTIDRTLENIKNRAKSTKVSFPKRTNKRKKVDKHSKENKEETSDANVIGSGDNVIQDQTQNEDNKAQDFENKIVVDIEPHTSLPRNLPPLKSSKIIFAAPQQPGDPFIPIRAYRQESTNMLTNEINESRPNAFNKMSMLNQASFEIIWRSLTFYPPNGKITKQTNNNHRQISTGKRTHTRPILNNVSGMFSSGQMTGIMGPSGSGKTVLLNCIAGFLKISSRKENTGDIMVNGMNSIRIGFVEQFDRLNPYLTVRETLMFTSKIRNAARYYLNHNKIVNNVMKRLDLLDVENNRVSRCSNGQRKRISIAIELVYNSDIIMLDEPTTGVDSVNGYQIMSIMKTLTKRRKAIAILATIHQPSAKMFALFDNLILLSCEGTIIFQGHPSELTQTLQLVGLSCPIYTSMSDFALEVASGDFGRQSLHLLTHYNHEYNRNRFTDDFNEVEMHSLREAVKYAHLSDQRSVLFCTFLVLWRGLISSFRNPFSFKIRIVALSSLAIFLGLLFTDSVGHVSTCPTKYFLWLTNMENLIDTIEKQNMRARENASLMFLVALVSLFNSMLNLAITMPEEIYVFRREYNNYSYSIFTFFMAKTLSELPFTMTTTAGFVWAVHLLTGQIFDDWSRVCLCILPCCLITLIGQFIGIIIGVLFYKSQVQAIYAITFLLIPIMLCSGFFKLIKNMDVIMAYMSYMSFLRPTLNALMIIIYGVGRCKHELDLEYEQIQQLNATGEYHRPEWIDSVVQLINFQMSTVKQDNETKALMAIANNETLENEDKLILYLGLSFEGGVNSRANVLQFLELGSTSDSYWNQILEILAYILLLILIGYFAMIIRLKRQKN